MGEGAGVEEAAQEGAVGQVPVGDVHLVRQRRRLPRPLQRHRVVVVEVIHAHHPCTRHPRATWLYRPRRTTGSNTTGRPLTISSSQVAKPLERQLRRCSGGDVGREDDHGE